MTAEGQFPKIPGDIAYASEANRFAGAGIFIQSGSTLKFQSGTNSNLLGSIIISGNSLYPISKINIIGNIDCELSIELSGISANASVTAGELNPSQSHTFQYYAIIGSPYNGGMFISSLAANSSSVINDSNNIGNLNLSQDIVIKFNGRYSGAVSGGVGAYFIDAQTRGY